MLEMLLIFSVSVLLLVMSLSGGGGTGGVVSSPDSGLSCYFMEV